jgi:DNA-binding transcriptional LysR family regulator
MRSIHGPVELAAIDLNLLVVFDALAREKSVTRAAERVGVTQSAMSHALRRLRDLLGDPLLVRGRSGMVLTPRAEALVVPLRAGLMTIARALGEPARFEPATARRSFSIATPDLFDVLAIPPLLERVRREGPGIDLAVVRLSDRLDQELETGEVDAAVIPQIDGGPPPLAAPGMVRRTLLHDRFTCLIRAGHPALPRRKPASLSLEAYLALSHALISPSGEGPGLVDLALERRGLRRRIALRIPHFYPALPIVARSDLVLTAPRSLATLVPAGLPIVSLPPPLRVPGHSLHLIWHERFSDDDGHRWLRDLVAAVVRSLT